MADTVDEGPGRLVNRRYALDALLGEGGMGAVYRARDLLRDNRLVALKLLVPKGSPEDAKRHLRSEFYTLTRLRHPNLVGVHDLGVDRDSERWFLTMEYVPGSTLADWQPDGRLPLLDLTVCLLRALDFIHARGYVHADVKPENILIPESGGEPRIADFGLASALGTAGAVRGTLPYLAPEVLRGDAPTPASDFYALGATLYRAVAGHGPFDGPTPDVVIDGHLRKEPPFPPELLERLPEGFPVVLRHLLAKDPASRPQSGQEVIRAINDLVGTRFPIEMEALRTTWVRRGSFVGRGTELTTIDQRLERLAGNNEGGLILLSGAAGLGKTRLTEELRSRAQMDGLTVVAGLCRGLRSDPFDAAHDVLRDLIPLTGSVAAPPLEQFLRGTSPPPAEMEVERIRVLEAAAQLVRRTAQTLPLVLIFEDLHRADPDLLGLLVHLVRGTLRSPVLTVLTSRGDEQNPALARALDEFASEPESISLPLEALDREEAARLVAALLNTPAPAQEVVDFILEAAGGNPYLIGESVQALIAGETLRRDADGSWGLTRSLSAGVRLPASLQEAALESIRDLPPPCGEVLDHLAISGMSLDRRALERLSGQGGEQLDGTLDTLVAREVVVCEESSLAGPSYRMTHAFLRDALYHRLGEDDLQRRASMHEELARDLAAHAGGGIEDVAAELAMHYDAAGRPREAVGFFLRAAERSRNHQALDAASHHYKRALEIMSSDGEEPSRESGAWEHLGDVLRLAARPEEADGAFEQALRMDVPGRTGGQRASLIRKRATVLNLAGQYDRGRELALQALDLYRLEQDEAGLADCEMAIGSSHARRGEHGRAETRYRHALEVRRKLDDPSQIAGSLANLGMVTFFQGHHEEGRSLLEEALETYRSAGDTAGTALAANNLGYLATEEGRLTEARSRLEEAEAAYKSMGSLRYRAECLLNLAKVFLRTGLFHRAADLSQQAAELYARLGMRSEIANAHEFMGHAQRESGRHEAAVEAHQRGLAMAQRATDAAQEGFCFCALSLDHLAAGDAEAAATVLARSNDLPEEVLGTRLRRRLDRARAHLSLAQGRAQEALDLTDRLLASENEETDRLESLDVGLLRARALTTLARFQEAETALDELLPRMQKTFPARRWEALRLKAASQDGVGRSQEADETRQLALEALAELTARLPDEYRASLESSREAVSLRLATGGTETARVAPPRFLDTMYEVIEALTTFDDTDAMLDRVMSLAVELLGAERGLILLFPEDLGEPRVATVRNLEEETIADAVSYSCRVVEEGRLGRSLASADARSDPRLKDFASVSLFQIRSILCVPMRARDRVIGTVYLDSRTRTIGFDEDDLRFLEAFAQHAATALDSSRMMRALERENLILRRTLLERYSFAKIVGGSPRMQEIFGLLKTVTSSSLPVLVQGESGTGKELVARALHYNGPRREGPFLTENCAAFPESLLESQLFGHVQGAFTGASSAQRGLLQEADRGSLFLDEIGEMSPALQARLTRVLETGEFRPVGGSHVVKVDVRIIAATHRDLERMVDEGRFRRDLLFRLNVISIDLPPLRDRKEDVPLLVSHFLEELSREMDIEPPGIEDGALELLAGRDWPGNVRQLRNDISRLMVFRAGEVITARDVRETGQQDVPMASDYLEETGEVISLKELERRHILRALQEAEGDRTRAARLLKVGRATVFRKIKDYKLDA
jgi:Nif-specific regulatory protein